MRTTALPRNISSGTGPYSRLSVLFLALSPCNQTVPSGTRTRRLVNLKFAPLEYGTSTISPPTPTARLNTNCVGFVGDTANTTSPRRGVPRADNRSTSTTSPRGLNVGIMLGPTHNVTSTTCVFTAAITIATRVIYITTSHRVRPSIHPSIHPSVSLSVCLSVARVRVSARRVTRTTHAPIPRNAASPTRGVAKIPTTPSDALPVPTTTTRVPTTRRRRVPSRARDAVGAWHSTSHDCICIRMDVSMRPCDRSLGPPRVTRI